ncbi:MAG TPA: RDD family protein [Burkholderiales bacterium]|nr:RDD family protein [Burkholderiales bacterium]
MENSSSSSPSEAAPSRSVEYVGFWKRFVAFVIDMLIVFVVVGLALFALYGQLMAVQSDAVNWTVNGLLVVATILFWRYRGATPGKMAISAKIVDARTFGPPSTVRLVVRYFAYILSSLPLGLGFVWIGIDRRKQAFHDKIAGTVVVYDDD